MSTLPECEQIPPPLRHTAIRLPMYLHTKDPVPKVKGTIPPRHGHKGPGHMPPSHVPLHGQRAQNTKISSASKFPVLSKSLWDSHRVQ